MSGLGRYGSVALLSAYGDWATFSVLVSLVGIDTLASLMIARIVGGVLACAGHRHWTWSARRQIAFTRQGCRFLLLFAFSYLLSATLFSLFTEVFRMPAYPAKLVTDSTCFIVNFMVMNRYIFHGSMRLSGLTAKRDEINTRHGGRRPAIHDFPRLHSTQSWVAGLRPPQRGRPDRRSASSRVGIGQ